MDRSIITATAPLNSKQQADLESFTSAWVDLIANPKGPKSLDDARRTLTEPLRDPSSTDVFRRAASQSLLPKLEPIIEGVDAQRSIHALQVVRFLRTPESIETLTGRLSASREPDVGKRLAAASVLGYALTDAGINPVQCDAASRAIAAAGSKEAEALIVVQEVKALSAITKRPSLPASSIDSARSGQIGILRAFVGDIGSKPRADARMQAVRSVIVTLRNDLLATEGPAKLKFGIELAPALREILAAAAKHWDSVQSGADQALSKTYSDVVAGAETLLRVVDKSARPNQAAPSAEKALANAWDQKNRKAFDGELELWTKVLGQAPYR